MNSSRQSGAAMVELAIVLPLLLVIFFGIAEVGRLLYQQNMLSQRVANVTRFLARTYQGIEVGESSCSINAAAWNGAGVNAANVLRYGDVDGGGDALLADLQLASITVTSAMSLGRGVENVCVIRVTGTAKFIPIVGETYGIGAIDLSASAEERYIGE